MRSSAAVLAFLPRRWAVSPCPRAFGSGTCSTGASCAPPHSLPHSPALAPRAANGTTALQSGILHGCGRQKHGAVVNGAANYALGLPLMLLFAFKLHGGAEGLWWGIAAASLLQAAVLVALVSGFDWRAEAERAARLVKHLSKADGLGSLAEEGGEEAQLSGARSLEAAVSGDALMPLPAVRGV